MVGPPEGLHHTPVNVLQYGFMLHADWLESRDPATLRTLESSSSGPGGAEVGAGRHMCLVAPNASAQVPHLSPLGFCDGSGEAISFYLGMYPGARAELAPRYGMWSLPLSRRPLVLGRCAPPRRRRQPLV